MIIYLDDECVKTVNVIGERYGLSKSSSVGYIIHKFIEAEK
jgi:hypothetical protein